MPERASMWLGGAIINLLVEQFGIPIIDENYFF